MADGGRLTVGTSHSDGRVIVKIEDTGCGMSAEQLEQIFAPFFTTKAAEKGTGLGLSVCFSIVEGLGGKIYAESQLGKGSRFILELPYELGH